MFWRQLRHGVRALTRRRNVDHDLNDEVQHYLEQAAAAHVRRGLPPNEALRAARIELGGVTQVTEQMRSYGWENVLDTISSDVRYGVRRLRAAPGFTLISAFTLARGIGATTAIFSVVSPVLFEPLPYPAPDRIAMLWEIGRDGRRAEGSFGMYRGIAQRTRSFEAIALFKAWLPTITGDQLPERLNGQHVSASYFRVLGVTPHLGRDFEAADDSQHGPNVVILSDGFWRRRYGANPAILGRHIRLDDVPFTVIGVMRNAFLNMLAPAADVWAPLQYDMSQGKAWGHHLRTVGRLRTGVSYERATDEVNAIAQTVIEEQRPTTYPETVSLIAVPLKGDLTRGVRSALVAILVAVALVLVIACVNVTNLLLTRDLNCRGELALRAALGARSSRLVRQLLTESMLLALLGGTMAMTIAMIGVPTLVRLIPAELPRSAAISVNESVFAFALALTTLVGVLAGLFPALSAARHDPQVNLQRATRRSIGGQGRMRSALVVAEVSLALVLLVSSGLLLRSFQQLFRVDPGFDPSQLLTMQVQTAGSAFSEDSIKHRFFSAALDAVRAVPGVTAAALTNQLPLSGDNDQYGVVFERSTATATPEGLSTFRYSVSPGYFEVMRIPLRKGRLLEGSDVAGAPLVAVFSESVAASRLRGVDPIGRRLSIGPSTPLYTVVGVVGDVRQTSLALSETDAVYVSATQWHFADNAMSLVARTRGDASDLAAAIRQSVWSVDKDQPIVRTATMAALLGASAAERRFALTLFQVFALTALVLAAAGLYGVVSGGVSERTRELGARAALGATSRDLLQMVLRHGLRVAGIGVAIGLALAAVATTTLRSMLFDVSQLDAVTYASVVALLMGVALMACAVPAWRASRIDPASVLRSE